jgi:hypothetical protein
VSGNHFLAGRASHTAASTHLSFAGSIEQSRSQLLLWFSEQGYCLKTVAAELQSPHPFAFLPSGPHTVRDNLGVIKRPSLILWSFLAEALKARRGRHADMLQCIQERRILGWKTLKWTVSSLAQSVF